MSTKSIDERRADVADNAFQVKKDSVGLKLISLLLAVLIIGGITCIIIGIVKAAVDAVFISGAVLLIVALLVLWGYHSLKYHISAKRYQREIDKLRKQ